MGCRLQANVNDIDEIQQGGVFAFYCIIFTFNILYQERNVNTFPQCCRNFITILHWNHRAMAASRRLNNQFNKTCPLDKLYNILRMPAIVMRSDCTRIFCNLVKLLAIVINCSSMIGGQFCNISIGINELIRQIHANVVSDVSCVHSKRSRSTCIFRWASVRNGSAWNQDLSIWLNSSSFKHVII